MAAVADRVKAAPFWCENDPPEFVQFLDWIVDVIPPWLGSRQGLLSLASACVAGRWKGTPVQPSNAEDLVAHFRSFVGYRLLNILNMLETRCCKVMPKCIALNTTKHAQQRLLAGYRRLKAAFPESPWPDVSERSQNGGANAAPGDRWEATDVPTSYLLMGSVAPRINFLDIFIMTNGQMGLGPQSIQKGDVVMTVEDGRVPQAETIRTDLKIRLAKKTKHLLEMKLKNIESEIEQKIGWELVGEAYLGLSLSKQELEELAKRVDIISIV
jgi:hypothetical protein